MKDEILPVVNDFDQVIGTELRSVIHSQGLTHRAVHVLIFNTAGELFLQKRSMLKDLNPGLWDTSAAGHVDAHEDYDQTAKREIQEELGIEIDSTLEFLFKLNASLDTGMEFIKVYRCVHNGPFLLSEAEISEGNWVSPVNVSDRVRQDDQTLTTTFKKLWLEFCNLDEA